jgi:hypothetical protein
MPGSAMLCQGAFRIRALTPGRGLPFFATFTIRSAGACRSSTLHISQAQNPVHECGYTLRLPLSSTYDGNRLTLNSYVEH